MKSSLIANIWKPENSNEGSYIGQFFAPVMMGGWEALSPTQDLIDSYPCKDGKSIRESPFYNPEDPFADRDPRLGFSVLWNGSQIAGKTFNLNNMGDGSHTRTGYSMKSISIRTMTVSIITTGPTLSISAMQKCC